MPVRQDVVRAGSPLRPAAEKAPFLGLVRLLSKWQHASASRGWRKREHVVIPSAAAEWDATCPYDRGDESIILYVSGKQLGTQDRLMTAEHAREDVRYHESETRSEHSLLL